MNHCIPFFNFKMLFLIAALTVMSGPAYAANPGVDEREQQAIDLKLEEQIEAGPIEEVKPVSGTHEGIFGIPEIPKSATPERLSPADRVRIAEIEDTNSGQDMTQTEADLAKDSVVRRSNIRF
ncbi:MAG TPA: hypothetical protein VD913_00010 [bacterium]|nr:hypothetical protein [bacterium]